MYEKVLLLSMGIIWLTHKAMAALLHFIQEGTSGDRRWCFSNIL